MRKLGHGQSVVFCVPREIKVRIREILPTDGDDENVKVSDILIWSIQETWSMLQKGVQLWATQGRRHEKHRRLWDNFTGGERPLEADQAEQFLEAEAQTILQRYLPHAQTKDEACTQESQAVAESDPILERMRDFGVVRCDAALLHEEQERELAPEIETEREQELPPPAIPARHSLHSDVARFVTDGQVVTDSSAYRHAFATLDTTRPGRDFDVADASSMVVPTLLATADFARTVEPPPAGDGIQDLYLRPVQWVLVRRMPGREPVMLIISPFEANHLVPTVSRSRCTTLHIYTPRVNTAFPSLDNLRLFPYPREPRGVIPRELVVGLDLFAGQLYFNNYDMYVAACKFLGVSWEKAKNGEVLDSDGFILRGCDGRVGGGSGFRRSPVKFFRDLMLLRRDSQAIGGTHVGDLLDNRPLSEDVFD